MRVLFPFQVLIHQPGLEFPGWQLDKRDFGQNRLTNFRQPPTVRDCGNAFPIIGPPVLDLWRSNNSIAEDEF